jgi:hypothetical protein
MPTGPAHVAVQSAKSFAAMRSERLRHVHYTIHEEGGQDLAACSHDCCAIYYQAGDCAMPREGIFVRVLEPGALRTGDAVEVLSLPE